MIELIVFLPFLLAIYSYHLGRRHEVVRDRFVVGVCFLELFLCLVLCILNPRSNIPFVLGSGLHFAADGFRLAYAILCAFMWALTTLFSQEYFFHEREGLNHYYVFVLMTLGATEGVFLSADLMTAFVFFEILSFTSFTWVIHEQSPGAIRAGYTYLFIAVIGGLVLLMGLLLLQDAAGTLTFARLPEAVAASEKPGRILAAALCILVGFGCKAGMFPVHVWLPKAHPVAPSPASALLSGILTKVGIYGILMTTLNAMLGHRTYGLTVLTLGALTMALGALLALFSINLKRTLACSSMSQVGFILTGLGAAILAYGQEGEGFTLAYAGTVLHMVNHSLIKLTLFMAAGVVVMNLGALSLDEIRGYGRNKPFFKAAFALGALGISGVPFFNGYLSKTLLHEGIVEAASLGGPIGTYLHILEWVFLVSGGFTFAYMLKLFICLFVEKNRDKSRQAAFDAQPRCMSLPSTVCVFGSSLLMVLLGQPVFMKALALVMTGQEEIRAFEAFSLANLKGGGISLGIGLLVYLVVVRGFLMQKGSYVNRWPARLDLEELVYRPLLTDILPEYFGGLVSVFGENKVFAPLGRFLLPDRLPGLMSLFGENKLLTPLFEGVLFLSNLIGRALADSLDFLIVLLGRTVLRERRVVRAEDIRENRLRQLDEEWRETSGPILQNFSFALMMTCFGILIILVALIICML